MGNVWKLEDAKARFSELVRRARSEGPQRGKDAVVVASAEEMERLRPSQPARTGADLIEMLRGSGLADLELPPRDCSPPHDVDLDEVFGDEPPSRR